MSAEAWPTEVAATAAVEAAARKTYEDGIAARAQVYPDGVELTSWDDLHAVGKLEVRNAVLPIVWAALAALPDPRYAVFEEGYAAGRTHSTEGNPYPSGL